MISGIVTGKLFTDMIDMVSDLWDKGWEGVWEMVKGMWTQGVESFENAWNNPNPEEKWKFFGKIVGMILFEVVLAILTAGVGAAVSAAAKTSVLVTKLPKLVKVIDVLTPEVSKYKVPEVDKDRLLRKTDVDVNTKKLVDDLDINGPDYAKKTDPKHLDDGNAEAKKEIDDKENDAGEKQKAYAIAYAITLAADVIDIPVTQLVLDLQFLRKYKGVKGFDYEPNQLVEFHDIYLIASKKKLSKSKKYTGGHKFGFPFRSLRGKSIQYIKRNKPKGWREVPTRDNEGFIWIDDKGKDRLRFMRPKKGDVDWERQKNGYFRWETGKKDIDGNPEYLDIDGNVIPWNPRDVHQKKTHIDYEGLH